MLEDHLTLLSHHSLAKMEENGLPCPISKRKHNCHRYINSSPHPVLSSRSHATLALDGKRYPALLGMKSKLDMKWHDASVLTAFQLEAVQLPESPNSQHDVNQKLNYQRVPAVIISSFLEHLVSPTQRGGHHASPRRRLQLHAFHRAEAPR